MKIVTERLSFPSGAKVYTQGAIKLQLTSNHLVSQQSGKGESKWDLEVWCTSLPVFPELSNACASWKNTNSFNESQKFGHLAWLLDARHLIMQALTNPPHTW